GMMPAEDEQSGFVVKDIKASFLATAALGDLLDVKTTVLKLRNSSTLLQQEVYRENSKLFTMEILLVYVKEGKPVRIPEAYRELFGLYQ
ncbi:MAG: hotdog domain-containing protein, partial [Campylobacterota bacterium]|nr:hotdog domain-containing protein [Campylobacterota bacterium]